MNSHVFPATTRRFELVTLFLVLFILLTFPAHGQVSTKISSVLPAEAPANLALSITTEIQQQDLIERMYFIYRTFGQSQWKRTEMNILGNTATTLVPGNDVQPPFLEYYIVLVDHAEKMESYPISESAEPLIYPPNVTQQIVIRADEDKDEQIVFLSPEPDVRVTSSEVLISVSLFRADTGVVINATKMFLDDADVTDQVVFADNVIVYAPENSGNVLKPGRHKVTVRLYDQWGQVHRSSTLFFTVVGHGLMMGESGSRFTYGGIVDLESRHENIAGGGTFYNRGRIQLHGKTGVWKFTGSAFITSDEKEDRQPQNRYFVGVESPIIKVGYGDSYPAFPNLVLNGKRIRGINSSLHLGFFNVDVALGKTQRQIEGRRLKEFPLDSLAKEQAADPNAAYGKINSTTWGKFSYGTYDRDLFIVRPSFGSGETYQVGFTWLKSKDDVSSIRFGNRPQENLVVGSDLIAKFDNGRIEIFGQGAFSAYNSDISSGHFTDAYIDSVFKGNAAAVKRARDILQNVITVNDNLRPLSLETLSTLSYEAGLGLDYFGNAARFTYLYRGSDYNSFGQTFLRTDISGFNVVDRIRLPGNRFYVTLGFEQLKDNTSKTKPATTEFTTLNAAVSYYSITQFPNVTVGFSRFANLNPLSKTGRDSSSAIDDATNRFFIQTSGSFHFGAPHTASLNVSTSSRSDNTVRRFDVQNTAISFGLNTRYAFPLQTSAEYSLHLNEFPGMTGAGSRAKLNYSTVSLAARYSFLNDMLLVNTMISPTFGDFNRLVLDIGGQWYIMKPMNLSIQYSLFQNQGLPNDGFWSLRYSYRL